MPKHATSTLTWNFLGSKISAPSSDTGMAGLVAPEDEAWRVTNELIASNGTMAGATAAVREALDRKAQ